MWPFKRNTPSPDAYSNYIDCSQFLASEALRDLTPEEREEVRRGFGALQSQRYHPKFAGDILGASASATLCNLASGIVREVCEMESAPELNLELEKAGHVEATKFRDELKQSADRAIWLAHKATDLYAHPVVFERLAGVLEAIGRNDAATSVRELQSKREKEWVSRYTDKLLMIDLARGEQIRQEPD
jgi:hypothetical protein